MLLLLSLTATNLLHYPNTHTVKATKSRRKNCMTWNDDWATISPRTRPHPPPAHRQTSTSLRTLGNDGITKVKGDGRFRHHNESWPRLTVNNTHKHTHSDWNKGLDLFNTLRAWCIVTHKSKEPPLIYTVYIY